MTPLVLVSIGVFILCIIAGLFTYKNIHGSKDETPEPNIQHHHSYLITQQKRGIHHKLVCVFDSCNFARWVRQEPEDDYKACPECDGYGKIEERKGAYGRVIQEEKLCSVCNGEGKVLTLKARINKLEDKVNFHVKAKED